jgi:hypothetical protein
VGVTINTWKISFENWFNPKEIKFFRILNMPVYDIQWHRLSGVEINAFGGLTIPGMFFFFRMAGWLSEKYLLSHPQSSHPRDFDQR